MKNSVDCIAAICTPLGLGGIGIVRVSGNYNIICKVAKRVIGKLPVDRVATLSDFKDEYGENIDNGIVLYFKAPHSYTGEDVLEFQGHGGIVVVESVLASVLECGVRIAMPGEFSQRAFLNNKMDLVQAESVVDLIEAGSKLAAKSAVRSLTGEFSKTLNRLHQEIIEQRVKVEFLLEFSEDELEHEDVLSISVENGRLLEKITNVLGIAKHGNIIREGIRLVITGRTNVGKSSLFNRITAREAAIVTDESGTTRDVLREKIVIDGLVFDLIDTAGLGESSNKVEMEGIRRAWLEIENSDYVLFVMDDKNAFNCDDIMLLDRIESGKNVTIVRNKIDVTGREFGCDVGKYGEEVYVSVKENIGMDLLKSVIRSKFGAVSEFEGCISANQRQILELEKCTKYMGLSIEELVGNWSIELAAENMRLAQNSLGEITGEIGNEEFLDRIFSRFCIGK